MDTTTTLCVPVRLQSVSVASTYPHLLPPVSRTFMLLPAGPNASKSVLPLQSIGTPSPHHVRQNRGYFSPSCFFTVQGQPNQGPRLTWHIATLLLHPTASGWCPCQLFSGSLTGCLWPCLRFFSPCTVLHCSQRSPPKTYICSSPPYHGGGGLQGSCPPSLSGLTPAATLNGFVTPRHWLY